MDERAISMITGNSFAKRLQGPISRGMLRHMEVNDAPRSDVDQQQYIENPKAGGDGDDAITGDDRLGVIVNESLPGLQPWPSEEDSVDLPLVNMRSKKITPRAIATHLGPGEPASHTEVLAAVQCNVARIHRPRCAEAAGPGNNTFPRRRAHP